MEISEGCGNIESKWTLVNMRPSMYRREISRTLVQQYTNLLPTLKLHLNNPAERGKNA